MAISKKNIDLLFDVMNYYDNQYNNIADTCFDETKRVLTEICSNIDTENLTLIPNCSYAIKNNYQIFEPIEFYCVLKSDRNILQKEIAQKKQKKAKRTIKSIYNQILATSNQTEKTAIDIAKKIAEQFQEYITEDDTVQSRNNVVYVKYKINEEENISVIIHVGYDFDNDNFVELTKLGYKIKENPTEILKNIQQKNINTNGNYLLICKLIKMLELELILTNQSNILVSSKTLFLENVLYNVPDQFFITNDFSEMLNNIINYLNQCNIDNIKLADNSTIMFKQNNYYANSHFKNLIKKLSFILINGDQMIDQALNENKKTNNKTFVKNDNQNN